MGIGRLLLLPASLVRCLKVAPSLSREVFPLKSDARVESFFELCKCFAKKFHFFLKKGRKTLRFYLDSSKKGRGKVENAMQEGVFLSLCG